MSEGIERVEWIELPRADKGEVLKNPFCGLYRIYRFDASSEWTQNHDEVLIEDCQPDPDMSLALVEINLKAYNSCPLPESALNIIERVFLTFESYGVQMILRFLYDWDGVNIQTEPKSIETILLHMEQISPLLRDYERDIYIIQGLFIGNWGEMHGSRYIKNNSLYRLFAKLKTCVGENTYIAVRSPALWRLLLKSFDPPASWNDAWLLKLGLYNDGMMASENDYGTYGTLHRAEVKNFEDKMHREYEMKFQNSLCQFVPNGGEVVHQNSFNDFEMAVETMQTLHVSYINSEYDTEVLDKWKRTVLGSNWGPWKGKSGYDYIAGHLGYRYRIERVRVSPDKNQRDHVLVELQIKNTGFSICYRRLNLYLVVYGENDTETEELEQYETELSADNRAWQPNVLVNIEGKIDVSRWFNKTMRLAIRAEDPLGDECVQFSNTFFGTDVYGNCLLGAFTPKGE